MSTRVLIADDEPNILLSLEFLLQQAGFDVALARDGAEALEKAQQLHPQLIMLDVMMPRKNGYEVCQALREDPGFADTRILMLTAKGRETEVAKGLAVGADAYVTKPFGTKALLAQVQELLGGAVDAAGDA
ncbi:MAG: response regulator [Chromatiales bacterium]|nr:response regulator [Chromatiales bacterium]